MFKNKNGNKKKIIKFFTVLTVFPFAVFLIYLGCRKFKLESNEWITLLASWVSATATIWLGVVVYFQNELHNENIEEESKKASDREKLYHDEMRANRLQDLMIQTAPYFAFKDIDSFTISNFGCGSNENSVLFYEGKYEKGINCGTAFFIRFVLECDQIKGLNNIEFKNVSIYTEFDGEKCNGNDYKFINKDVMSKSDISILERDKYQFILKLVFVHGNDDLDRSDENNFINDLLKSNNFMNVNYSVSNLYDVKIDGTLKFQFILEKNNKNEYCVTNLNSISNWVDNPRI